MLMSADQSVVVSSLGWVDRNSLWLYCRERGTVRSVRLGHGSYITLCAGTVGHFAAVHHSDGGIVEVTVHSIHRADDVLARVLSQKAAARSRVTGRCFGMFDGTTRRLSKRCTGPTTR